MEQDDWSRTFGVDNMVNTLIKHGNDFALIVDRDLIAQLGIDEHTPLQVTVSQGCLVVAPDTGSVNDKKFAEIAERVIRERDSTLRRLASE